MDTRVQIIVDFIYNTLVDRNISKNTINTRSYSQQPILTAIITDYSIGTQPLTYLIIWNYLLYSVKEKMQVIFVFAKDRN